MHGEVSFLAVNTVIYFIHGEKVFVYCTNPTLVQEYRQTQPYYSVHQPVTCILRYGESSLNQPVMGVNSADLFLEVMNLLNVQITEKKQCF